MKKIGFVLWLGIAVFWVHPISHAGTGDIFIQRTDQSPKQGDRFSATIVIDTGTVPLGGYMMDIEYDESVFAIELIQGGEGFSGMPLANNYAFTSGLTRVTGSQGGNLSVPDGPVSVFKVDFSTIGEPAGYSPINLKKISVFDTDGTPIPSDVDSDDDGISDIVDNSPNVPNTDQVDTDSDGIGDAGDSFPYDPDNDGIESAMDNCPDIYNPVQEDADIDEIGDICDTDDDNDGLSDIRELALGTDPYSVDTDKDGYTDGQEIDLELNPSVKNEKATINVSAEKEFYGLGEAANIRTIIENQGIDIVEGKLALKLVTSEDSITGRTWSSKDDFQEGIRNGVDTCSSPGNVKLLSLDDDFDTNILNTDRWSTQNYVAPKAAVVDGSLRMYLPDNPSGSWIHSYVHSRETIDGDFEVSVDYRIPGPWYKDNNHPARLEIGAGSFWVYIDVWGSSPTYGTKDSYNTYTNRSRAAMEGRLKISRQGSTYRTYYWNENSWVLLKEYVNRPKDEARISLKTFGQKGNQEAFYDNLKIVSENDSYPSHGTWTAQYDSGIEGFEWGYLNWTGESGCLLDEPCATNTLFSGLLLLGDGNGELTNRPKEYQASFHLDHFPVEDIRVFIKSSGQGSPEYTSVRFNDQDIGYLTANGHETDDYSFDYFIISADQLLQGINTINIRLHPGTTEYDDIRLLEIAILEGTQIRFRTRTADTRLGLSAADWSEYMDTPGLIQSAPARYVELQAMLSTSNTDRTSVLDGISFNHSKDPDTKIVSIIDDPSLNLSENGTGEFYSLFDLPDVAGEYRLIGTVSGINGRAIDEEIIPVYVLGGTASLNVRTDKSIYRMEQRVQFAGAIDNLGGHVPDSTIPCTITIKDEAGHQVDTLSGEVIYMNPFEQMPFNISWNTYGRQAGTYTYDVNADTHEGMLNAQGTFVVTNEAPMLLQIADIVVTEGDEIILNPEYSDPDNNTLQITYSGWMNNKNYTTNAGDAGTHKVYVTISDGVLTTVQEVLVTVNKRNHPPELFVGEDIVVNEGETVSLSPVAIDPDNDPITITYSGWMNSDTYTTGFEDDGIHTVTVKAFDGEYHVSETLTIVVKNVNRPPQLLPVGDQLVNEGDTLMFYIDGQDPDGDALFFDSGNLPTGSLFDDDGQFFFWTPDYGSAGVYPDVLFRVVDSGTPPLSDHEMISIAVGDVNRPPIMELVGNRAISEGEFIGITINASDPDGDELLYEVSNLPIGANFDRQTHHFFWTPGFDQAGNYPDIYFTVTDKGDPPLSTTQTVQITVGDVNRPPVIHPLGDRTAREGEMVSFFVTANDPDNDGISYMAGNLPPGALFDTQTREFTWTPGFDQAGHYANIYFTVTDTGSPPLDATQTISITVGNVNRPPVLTPMGDVEIDALESYETFASGFDPDGDQVFYNLVDPPLGMEIDPVTGRIAWIPALDQQGNHLIQVSASDDHGASFSTYFTINVVNTSYPVYAQVIAAPDELWPPNHKLKDIHVSVIVSGTPDPAPRVVLTSVTSSEPDNGQGEGNTINDIQEAEIGIADFDFKLRAERSGSGSGRVYTITYTITDQWGNTAVASDYVRVPKSRKK